MNENKKYFLAEFYIQIVWLLLSIVGLFCNMSYALYGFVLAVVPFPISIFLNLMILRSYPFIAIFNVLFSITEIVFIICLVLVLFKDKIKKVYRLCNIFFHIILITYGVTCFSINEDSSFTLIWALILVLGIAIAVYSNVVNVKYKDSTSKITIDNAWNEQRSKSE